MSISIGEQVIITILQTSYLQMSLEVLVMASILFLIYFLSFILNILPTNFRSKFLYCKHTYLQISIREQVMISLLQASYIQISKEKQIMIALL